MSYKGSMSARQWKWKKLLFFLNIAQNIAEATCSYDSIHSSSKTLEFRSENDNSAVLLRATTKNFKKSTDAESRSKDERQNPLNNRLSRKESSRGRRRIQQAVTKRKDGPANRAMNFLFSQVKERDLELHPAVPYDVETHPFAYYETYGRKLQTTTTNPSKYREGFAPIRITFDTSSLDDLYNLSTTSQDDKVRIDAVRYQILPQIGRNLSNALSVAPVYGNLPVISNACYGAVNVSNSFVQNGVSNTDLIVFVEAKTSMFGEQLCCEGCTTLAAAATCETDQFDRPVSGLINFCLQRIPVFYGSYQVNQEDIDDATSVAEHELTHVLGFHGLMYRFYRHPETGEPLTPRPFCTSIVTCNDGVTYKNIALPSNNTLRMVQSANGDDHAFEITLPTVTQVARNQYDCQRVTGARLENQPTNSGDCFGSHFEERVNYDEAMSAFVQKEGMAYSALTLAMLEDSGWYKANFSVAEIAPWGHLAGCDFWDIDTDCVVDGKIPDFGKGFFCNTLSEANMETQSVTGTYQCYPGYTHMAVCDLFDMKSLGLPNPPSNRAYFPNQSWGPFFQQADFCPIAYHNAINCEENIRSQIYEKGSSLLPGESFEKGSRCFETTSDAPVCLKMQCVPTKQYLEVYVNGEIIICDTDGEMHDYPGLNDGTKIVCPRASVICPDMFCPSNCSGKGICQYDKELATASCQCFDPNDTSEACTESPSNPPLNVNVAICDAVITPVGGTLGGEIVDSDGTTSSGGSFGGSGGSPAASSAPRMTYFTGLALTTMSLCFIFLTTTQ